MCNATIDITAKINENYEDNYNQLIFSFGQKIDCALSHIININIVTKQEVLDLATKIKKLAKHFPNED